MLRVRDIMTTAVTTVGPGTSLREAAELFASLHISGAPVVDGSTVLGVVSASDILGFVGSTSSRAAEGDEGSAAEEETWEERSAWEAGDDPPARYFTEQWADAASEMVEQFEEPPGILGWDALDAHTVSEVMTHHVVSLPPTTDVATAADCLRAADVHRVLVMEHGELLGMVTTSDITRAVADGRVVRRVFVFDTSPVERDHDEGAF